MSVKPQRNDLFLALKGRIEEKIRYYEKPEVTATCSQPSRVVGRKEGYADVLAMIEEMLKVDIVNTDTVPEQEGKNAMCQDMR
jgi:hypothetical protein